MSEPMLELLTQANNKALTYEKFMALKLDEVEIENVIQKYNYDARLQKDLEQVTRIMMQFSPARRAMLIDFLKCNIKRKNVHYLF